MKFPNNPTPDLVLHTSKLPLTVYENDGTTQVIPLSVKSLKNFLIYSYGFDL